MRILAKAYYGNCDYSHAVNIIENIASTHELTKDLAAILGNCYMLLGEFTKSDKIYQSIKNDSSACDMSLLYQISRHHNDLEYSLMAMERLYTSLDSIFISSLNQNLCFSIAEYHHHDKRLKEEKLHRGRLYNLLIALLVGIIVLLLSFYFYRIVDKQRRQIELNILTAQNLKDILSLKEKECKEAQNSIQNMLASRFEILDNLCQNYFDNKNSKNVEKKISYELNALISDFSLNGSKRHALETTINNYYSGVMTNFRSDLPSLKDADYLLFLYSILGFSNAAIALFLREEKIAAVYNRKARLKYKINLLNTDRKNIYLSFL